MNRVRLLFLLLPLLLALPAAARQAEPAGQRFPNVVILTVDTLRADRLSSYGYRRTTTPNIDRLLTSGARFAEARTVEPLTNPSLCSMFTSLYPHEHGATRNGLRLRPDLPSAARALARRGYRAAAFVGNWTLKNRISGLGDHFERYDEVFTRKRWLGLFKGEATAEDLTDAALAWLEERETSRRPFLLWVHYVDPHAPYRLQEGFARRLGLAGHGEVSRSDRYDTEVAFVDHHLGRLLAAFDRDATLKANTLFVFAADHGESLGEHGYWGHGRNLYEPTLRIPLGFAWAGRIRSGTTIDASALNIDVAPTILGLAGLPAPPGFRGFDWTTVFQGTPPPRDRIALFQAHKGAVLSAHEAASARRKGLLELGVMIGSRKEIFRLTERRTWLFDLGADPREARSLAGGRPVSPRLREWMDAVQKGLIASDRLGAAEVDPENVKQLQALGYVQ
ncbi:MAG TPA: sulfatase [Thermoanaerobaculia bacterium]|jgi:arylsulfatase A-like enzyme|nr:sulfatase [Thermoanaerobaculia bacterium]